MIESGEESFDIGGLIPSITEIDPFLVDDVSTGRRFVANVLVGVARFDRVIVSVGVGEVSARADQRLLFLTIFIRCDLSSR